MPKFSSQLIGFCLAMLLSGMVFAADPVALNPSHPDRYVVVKGDTLWDISERFLRDPWRWPDVWYVNPEIRNPHLIYPGDVIVLSFVDGQPRLGFEGSGDGRLSPHIRVKSLDTAIPTIPIDAIKQFLQYAYVMEKGELEKAPYVAHFVDEHIVGGAGNQVYVRAIQATEPRKYEVVRQGKVYEDPDTKEVLGYEALYVGDANLQRPGDPAKLLLTRTQMETLIGDRLLPVQADQSLRDFHPSAPDTQIEGKIISVLNGVNQIGQYNVVVLNKGNKDGLAPGHVMRVFQGGKSVKDKVRRGESFILPYEESGVLMVFRTFNRVSFGLVMYASDALHVLDTVRTPEI